MLSTTQVSFTAASGHSTANPSEVTVNVTTTGSWSARTDVPWLDIHCATGNCGSSFFIVAPARLGSLAPGTYPAVVTVSGPTSATLAVTLTITGGGTGGPAATITIDPTITYQRIDGFGTSERVFDDPHLTNTSDPTTRRSAVVIPRAQQDEILDKLYFELGLTRVRPVSPDTIVGVGIEPVNDNADPNVTDLTKFNFSWKSLDDHCDYVKRAQSRGVTTFFLSPLFRESWMGTQTATDAAEYAEWLLAQGERAVTLPTHPQLDPANITHIRGAEIPRQREFNSA
jgi:hypothetical protein